MDFYTKYKSPLGYQTGEGQIDTYGVDHSGFSTRDELKYQFSRQNKENQLIRNYNNQGITKNYPQYGTNFWGNPDNNYSFGSSNIHNNVENLNNNPFENTVNNTLGNSNNVFNSSINNNSIFSQNNMQSLNLNASSALYPQQNSFNTYSQPYQLAQNSLPNSGSDAASSNIDYSLYGNDFSKEFIDEMVKDKEFNQILNEYIIPNEGGLSDKPNDRGKLTKFGISKNTYPNEDILNLTRERANAIIYRDFYKWNGLNKLPYPIRGFVVDYGMPSSPLNAIKTVHKVLGLHSNGNIIGSVTMEKLKNFSQQDYEKFLEQYRQSMLEHYNNIVKNAPTQKGNLKGWLNRANRAHLGK